MKVAVVGAPGTGKTWLVRALSDAPPTEALRPELHDGPGIVGNSAFDLVLLMGLDLQVPSAAQLLADQSIRTALVRGGTGFRVVYGLGQARSTNALHALGALQRTGETALRYACDTCSDPDCEHQLFSRLLQGSRGPLQAG